ncbi:MAG TPA: hypothetical protein VMF30_12880 [Pirellulales bacterium]|nr:hypothetical protein [Pirellulales bacterium]
MLFVDHISRRYCEQDFPGRGKPPACSRPSAFGYHGAMKESGEPKAIVSRLHSHVFGTGAPCDSLVSSGTFPPDWCKVYLDLLSTAVEQWGSEPLWPRELVSAVHFASWYLDLRYHVWCTSSGLKNANTERQLDSLRSPSEVFLMRGSTLPRP